MSENVLVESRDLARRADLVALALKQGHRLSQCPACLGPVAHSKVAVSARCLGCGAVYGERLTRCWECGTSMPAPTVPPDLGRRNALGFAPLDQLAQLHTCAACGGQAEDRASVKRRSWRKCEGCKRPLSGPPPRGLDLCVDCRASRNRRQSRECSRRRASRLRTHATSAI